MKTCVIEDKYFSQLYYPINNDLECDLRLKYIECDKLLKTQIKNDFERHIWFKDFLLLLLQRNMEATLHVLKNCQLFACSFRVLRIKINNKFHYNRSEMITTGNRFN